MPLTPGDLRRCTLAAAKLLDRLGLSDYRFAVEPGGDEWRVEVEARLADAWTTLVVPFDPAELEATLDDEGARDRLLATWRRALDELRAPFEPSHPPGA